MDDDANDEDDDDVPPPKPRPAKRRRYNNDFKVSTRRKEISIIFFNCLTIYSDSFISSLDTG